MTSDSSAGEPTPKAVFGYRFWSSGAKPVCVAEQNIRYPHHQP